MAEYAVIVIFEDEPETMVRFRDTVKALLESNPETTGKVKEVELLYVA